MSDNFSDSCDEKEKSTILEVKSCKKYDPHLFVFHHCLSRSATCEATRIYHVCEY